MSKYGVRSYKVRDITVPYSYPFSLFVLLEDNPLREVTVVQYFH